MHAERALTVARAEAVGAGVAAAEDHHALALRADEDIVRNLVALVALVLQRQEFHREVDALKFAAGNRKVARFGRAHRERDRVILRAQLVAGDIKTDTTVGDHLDTLRLHLLDAPMNEVLLQLEIGNAVHQQAADAIGSLIEGDGMAGARELLRASEAGRSRANDGHALARRARRGLRSDPSLGPRVID